MLSLSFSLASWKAEESSMDLIDRIRSRAAAFVCDLTAIPLAWMGAFWLRFNMDRIPTAFLEASLDALPAVIVVQAAAAWSFGLYRGVWRFASVPDLVRIVKAIAAGVCLILPALFLLAQIQGIPRSIFPIYAIILLVLLGGPRLLYRWSKDRGLYRPQGRKALVIGAGEAGEMLVRELLRSRNSGYEAIGFVDDASAKQGREIHGVRVLGDTAKIPRLVERLSADVALLAIPAATSSQIRRIVDYCEQAGVPMKTLPSIRDLPSGRAGLELLREVSIEDLLGREPVSLNWAGIREGVAGRTVLVTGGGGSIGAELCRQLARLSPVRLVIVDVSEFNLFEIDRELNEAWPEGEVHALLGNCTDRVRMEEIFVRFRPSLVLHAAAYKHVPLLEHQAREAVYNNVMGTHRTANAAMRNGCETFVLISTDKAVNPSNVMGASKRLAEFCCQGLNRRSGATRFVAVRFGNVLDSAGSVVPQFRRQIAQGGPVTVTHPEVMRYFMTIPEACELILQAASVGKGGDIFVLDMGEPVSIKYLAHQMILLSGRKPGRDIDIVYTGLRPGEKLFEELFHESEALRQSGHPKLLLAGLRDLDWNAFDRELDALEMACESGNGAQVHQYLSNLVPEFEAVFREDSKIIPIGKAQRQRKDRSVEHPDRRVDREDPA